MGAPPEGTVESVAMRVREPGQDNTGQEMGIAAHAVCDDRGEPVAGDLKCHVPG
jgi:hypothetical protein